jgi:hypothetical protein
MLTFRRLRCRVLDWIAPSRARAIARRGDTCARGSTWARSDSRPPAARTPLAWRLNVLMIAAALLGMTEARAGETYSELLGADVPLANVVGPLVSLGQAKQLPIAVPAFVEHVREAVPDAPTTGVKSLYFDKSGALVVVTDGGCVRRGLDGQWHASGPVEPPAEAASSGLTVTSWAEVGQTIWLGTTSGLYYCSLPATPVAKHTQYGTDGPLATHITALTADAQGNLWVGTPLGLSVRAPRGQWRHLRGRDGLPDEDITALSVDKDDQLWIGTSRGAVHYRPQATGRQWFYRAGRRYLPDDRVLAVACAPDGTPYFATPAGVSRIALVETTLTDKARIIEQRVNERHRRFGLVAECELNDAERPTSHTIGDNDNDGLWTAYHVAAMSLCFGATHDPAAKASAHESMHALYLLQDASGTPGLVARSVVTWEEGQKKSPQWRPTPDKKMYWKSDTSSDEIDGHYLAFYTYWEHIAKDDNAERGRCIEQVREVTDYLLDHNYQLIDWTGKRTLWGFWNPENLNDDPEHFLESGLNSLQMLSFLRVAHHITGDAKYLEHYKKLIVEHRYLSNVLLQKKLFPDENNHSDDQLGFVAWYPILQLEHDAVLRAALHSAVRRHYLVVEPERASFYNFVYATIDPDHADIEAGVQNLRDIPTDRRSWRMENSHRADVTFDARIDRFADRQLAHVLPADERNVEKWNQNPYIPDSGGDGRHEDDGAAWLLPYWMGRYHGLIQ